MKLNDPRYKNQGIHVDITVFTVKDGLVSMLLVKRANEQFVGEWIIPGGSVYNNESIDAAAKRELEEKTGLKNIYLEQFRAFGEPDRDPRKRMVSIAYMALVDSEKVSVSQKTPKTLEAKWHDVTKLPKLAFDHNEIAQKALRRLRKLITESNITYTLLPNTFTLPELQNIYEIILGEKLDRRNFRRKFIALGLIKSTGGYLSGEPNRPAKLYKFTSRKFQEVNII